MANIHFKKQSQTSNHNYTISLSSTQIGEIEFRKKNNILIICFMEIYPEYRNKHYGYQVIEYLLSHYKTNCIIVESVFTAKTFWNKCIKKYNGMRKNIAYSANCTSSFVIPRYKISREEIYMMLKFVYENWIINKIQMNKYIITKQ